MSVVTLLLSPSLGRGTPEGQGVGRRRNRAKPTSGATRHLLPKEGGRSGMGKELVTQSMGSADSIAESDFTRVFIHSFAERRFRVALFYYRRRCPKVVFKLPVTSHSRLLLSALKLRGSGATGTTNLLAEVCHIINAEEFFPTPCDEENLAFDDLE